MQLVRDPNTDAELLYQLAHQGFLKEVVSLKKGDVSFLLQLLGSLSETPRHDIAARSPDLPELILKTLALDPNCEVRRALACRRPGALPDSVLEIQRRFKSLRSCVDRRLRGGEMGRGCGGVFVPCRNFYDTSRIVKGSD